MQIHHLSIYLRFTLVFDLVPELLGLWEIRKYLRKELAGKVWGSGAYRRVIESQTKKRRQPFFFAVSNRLAIF